MKLSTRFITLVAAALVLAAPSFAGEGEVAFIDLDKVFNALDKTQVGHDRVEQAKLQFKKEIEEMNAELESLLTEQDAIADEALNPALSEEVRKAKREEGEIKAVEISEYRNKKNKLFREREEQLQKQILRMRQDIIDDISTTAADYAREQGYLMVLDITGNSINQVPVVLYSSPKYDITDVIIDLLNNAE